MVGVHPVAAGYSVPNDPNVVSHVPKDKTPRDPHQVKNNNPPHTMTKIEIKGNWNIVKGTLKKKWAQLTDDDLQYLEGQEDQLLGRIQKRTGETREAVERAINDSCDTRH